MDTHIRPEEYSPENYVALGGPEDTPFTMTSGMHY